MNDYDWDRSYELLTSVNSRNQVLGEKILVFQIGSIRRVSFLDKHVLKLNSSNLDVVHNVFNKRTINFRVIQTKQLND
jgi:hypothetical protein